MKPYFSIIIPVYNVAPYLRACLDSVLAQTFTDWEAICVDDGSPDESGTILDEYAAKDSRFRVVHKQNEGVSKARNTAMDRATGEWICFLDSDDLIGRDWLKAMSVAASQSSGIDWIKLGCTWWWPDRGQVPELDRKVDLAQEICQCAPAIMLARSVGQGMPFLHVWRRRAIAEVRFPIRMCSPCEDEIFILSAFSKVTMACSIDYSGYYYRIRTSSMAHSKISPKNALNYLEEISDIMGDHEPKTLSRILNSSFCSIWCNGLGIDDEIDKCIKSKILQLRRNGFIRWRYVPRMIDKIKWLCFMCFGFWITKKTSR